ncbi:HNH endonuclease [Mycobacterium sp.]|uniref:HNH endonuclease n=1 Tax=Mycobacterium sp. TaxID=1785 RepID=UPI003F9A8C4F
MDSSRTGTAQWKRTRAQILQRDPYCQIRWDSRCTRISREVDHIIPTAADGTDDPTNLRGSCRKCNALKASAEGLYLSGRTSVPCPWTREPQSFPFSEFLDRISMEAEQRRQAERELFIPRTIHIGPWAR